MKKTICTLGLATLLLTGVSASGFAAGSGAQTSQSVTETQTGSKQLGRSGQGASPTTSTYGTNGTAGTTTYTTRPGAVAQSSPDAAHPTAQMPSGGGGESGGSSSGGSNGGGAGGGSGR
jgi:hypothetical protein